MSLIGPMISLKRSTLLSFASFANLSALSIREYFKMSGSEDGTDTPPTKKLKVTCSNDFDWRAQLWQNREQFADVVLIVAGEEFPVHKMVLASRSDYFKSLFYGGMKEATLKSITLFEGDSSVTASAFEKVLEYAYTKSLDIEEPLEEVLNIILVANYVQFDELKNTSVEILLDNIDINNVLKLLVFSKDNSVVLHGFGLETKCLQFIENTSNTCNVLKSSEFLELPRELVIELISRDTFVAPEKDILDMVIRWKKYNDVEDVDDMVQHIRLSRFSALEIFTIVEPTGLFKQTEILDCVRIIDTTNISETRPRGKCPKNNMVRGNFEISINRNSCHGEKVIDLGACYLLKFLSFDVHHSLSMNQKSMSYKYSVCVSMDHHNQYSSRWLTLFNDHVYYSRGKQILLFPTIPIRLVKIEVELAQCTTQNIKSHTVTHLKLMNDQKNSFKYIRGVIAPLAHHEVLFAQVTGYEEGKLTAVAHFNQRYSASTLLIKLACDDPNVSVSSINCLAGEAKNSIKVERTIVQDVKSEIELNFDEMFIGYVKVIMSTALQADKNLTISGIKCRSSATRDDVDMKEWGPFIRATTT